jgi:tetratricopeptide (TPR) repeat protein
MTTIDQMFSLATELRDNGDLRNSVGVLDKILADYPTDKKTYGVHLVLGGVHNDLKEHENALDNFKKATELNPKSELASLGLYVTFTKLDREEEAIKELLRFLGQFPADLYKDTLEELMGDIKDGYLEKFKTDITHLAKVNGVEFRYS